MADPRGRDEPGSPLSEPPAQTTSGGAVLPVGVGPVARAAYLVALFEQSPIGIAIFDPDLRYVAVNPALAAINGRPAENHPGRRVADLLPDMEAAVEPMMRSVLKTGRPLVGALTRGRTPADPDRDHVYEAAYYRVGGDDGTPLGVAAFVTDVTDREAAQQAVMAAQFRLAMVNEASARIGSTLDVDRTARELVEVAVPRFADAASVDVLEWLIVPEPTGRRADGVGAAAAATSRLAVGGRGGAALDALRHRAGDRVSYLPTSAAWEALRSGQPVAGDEPPDATLGTAVGPGGSYLLSPLLARGRVLGLASFARSAGSTPFDDNDLAVAAQLAARAATAVDNARLYERERSTAVALQRSLLPQEHPRSALVEIATRYLPGSVETEVGGDWYDVVPLAAGRVALVVGDVMGRGLRAAAAMGQLRTAVRTLAVLDLTPDEVVAQLDHVAESLEGVQLATCLYAVYDPVARVLSYASAGHLPPALLRPDGTASYLPLPSGAPLAVGGVPFEPAQVIVPDGSVVALFTDGLVESREQDLDTGMERLRRALADAPDGLEQLADWLLEALGRTTARSDDVALLVGRLTGVASELTAQWPVDPDLAAVSEARRLTMETLAAWGLESLQETTTLLVSELVTNAIRYARHPVILRLVVLEDRLVGSVQDSDARLPRLRRAGHDDEGGRGLHLVGILARRWGTRPTPEGKTVWFELPLPAESLTASGTSAATLPEAGTTGTYGIASGHG